MDATISQMSAVNCELENSGSDLSFLTRLLCHVLPSDAALRGPTIKLRPAPCSDSATGSVMAPAQLPTLLATSAFLSQWEHVLYGGSKLWNKLQRTYKVPQQLPVSNQDLRKKIGAERE